MVHAAVREAALRNNDTDTPVNKSLKPCELAMKPHELMKHRWMVNTVGFVNMSGQLPDYAKPL
jgi:hypothetical protein